MELDLDKNVGQVLSQLCGLLTAITDIYQYRGAKVNQMRRRIVSLLEFGLRKTIHAAKIGRPPLSSRRNYYRTSRALRTYGQILRRCYEFRDGPCMEG